MKQHIFLILIILISPLALFSQTALLGNDTLVKMINFIEGTDIENSQVCREKKFDSIITYTPNDINWYQYKYRRYFSRLVQLENETKRVFLEQITTGRVTLFYYCDIKSSRYFIESDGIELTELTEKSGDSINFHKLLEKYFSDCQSVKEAIPSVKFNINSLRFFIKRYNICDTRPYPISKFGFYLGLGRSALSYVPGNSSIAGLLDNAEFNKDYSVVFGCFLDLPVFKSDLTFHPELYYSKNAFSSNQYDPNIETDIIVNVSAINAPMLLRYTFPFRKVRPFINGGIVYSYLLKNENAVYEAQISNNIIEIQKEKTEELLKKNQIRMSFGLGCQYLLTYRHAAFVEMRYNTTPFFVNTSSKLLVKDLTLNIGIIF